MPKLEFTFVLSLRRVVLAPLERSDGFFFVILKGDNGEQGIFSRDAVVSLLNERFGSRLWTRRLRRALDVGSIPESVKQYFLELLIAVLYSPAPSSLVDQKRKN